MKIREARIKTVRDAPLAKGKNEYLKWLEGETLTRKQAMDAQCYVCMGYYVDGRGACSVELCPMRDYMPYNPKRRITRKMSDKQKKEAGDRLKHTRISRGVKLNSDASKRRGVK